MARPDRPDRNRNSDCGCKCFSCRSGKHCNEGNCGKA